MKFGQILAMIFALVLSIGTAFAVPSGKTVEYEGGKAGKVVFDGKKHADAGLKCNGCHTEPKLFAKKKNSEKMTMADMNAGKFCGACHNGKAAFKTNDQAACNKCHKK
jgi:c(7)-type cytochrome triheme protein